MELRKRFVEVTRDPYNIRVLAVAVELPSGAVETIVNYENIPDKVDYYLSAYDDDFKLKANTNVRIVGFMAV